MNVSEQLLHILKQEGVQHIFGVAGDALNPIISAIAKQDTIEWIRVKHEENGAYAAFAQGELGNNLGVCASTVGPGALHLINGLYNAKKERSPVLAITGQVPVAVQGTNFHQEVNLEKVFADVCGYQAIIRSPEQAPKIILKAIRTALNDNCVCRIELPADIAMMEAESEKYIHSAFRSESITTPPTKLIEEAVNLIADAKKIGILAGAGCRGAKETVEAFSNRINAPVTHTLRASDIFDHSMENVVGLTGLIGNPSGYKAVMEPDLLIMLGTDFPYTDFLPKETNVIQIDIRPENIGNRIPVTLGLHGDIHETVALLLENCPEKEDCSFLDDLKKEFREWKKSMEQKADDERELEPIHPEIFARSISEQAADDAIFALDTGTSVIWSSNFMNFHSERRIIGSFNHGSMAVGLPAALGAQFQFPEREVWAMVGDGAFNMTLHEFSTAVKYNLPIKVIVFKNDELSFVKIEMEEAGLAPNLDALHVDNFDFVAYAQLCGGEGIKVEHARDVEKAVAMAKASKKPFIIEAIVNSGELSLPPRIGLTEATDFGLSKVKEIIQSLGGNREQWENLKKEIEGYFD
ncbi:thiamine pyrophosphate-dependent enzyme [Prolixibacter denitrificans]|uniref:Pyruvate dehydrogenase n=1 Tax=Prolixibacter denitrificans TaxID=1541063 RepID=A0A2P8CDT0_9BACT|nr:thiamine pyrophosphate-dependent enzyme [Prolixibacter denitrificans]PSK83148.1 pyruvate dehydrogenase (quinone)/pyruvate oxidase [Prolixibacter denitrificans]GET21969.1 pyruvate dehydrogenase [Prolixibacter denitrificans]